MKFETKEETEERCLAWKTYRYFERNKALLDRAGFYTATLWLMICTALRAAMIYQACRLG